MHRVIACSFDRPWSCDNSSRSTWAISSSVWFLVQVAFSTVVQIGQEWGRQDDKAKKQGIWGPPTPNISQITSMLVFMLIHTSFILNFFFQVLLRQRDLIINSYTQLKWHYQLVKVVFFFLLSEYGSVKEWYGVDFVYLMSAGRR